MAEEYIYTALAMDRSDALGNSLDVFTRRALHTKIGNLPSEPIPVYITSPLTNTFYDESEDVTDPGVDKVILTGNLTLETLLSKLTIACRTESKVTLTVNGDFVAGIRTGAAQPNASFVWEPKRSFPAGATYEVTIKSRIGSPITDCEAHLMGITKP